MRPKNKATNATCMNVTTLYEGSLGVEKLTLRPCILRLFGLTKGGWRLGGGGHKVFSSDLH